MKNRGADALARALNQAGIRTIFALSGNHVMSLFDALLDVGIDLVHVRHEAAAVHMADAWGRLTGEPGIALVTGGPGHANAVSALYTAAMAESPVVLLSGHAPTNQLGRGAFQEMRQADIAGPLCKASWMCASADALPGDFARAVRIALSGRPGPVHLSLPSDLLEGPCEAPAPGPEQFSPERQPLDPLDAQRLLEWLAAGARPLVLCGPAALTPRGRPILAQAQAALGIPVVATESPRGVADPSLGDFARLLAQADRILLVGKQLDFTLRFGKAPAIDPECRFAQIDSDPATMEVSRGALRARLEATARADTLAALESLAGQANARPGGAWQSEVLEAVALRPRAWSTVQGAKPGRLHPVQALKPLQRLLDAHPEAVLVSDGGEFGQWAQAVLHCDRRVVNGVAGSIGAALPFAAAARLATDRAAAVVAVLGDGTFGFHPAEIDTAVRHDLPFVAVVGNDARWNAEYQIQVREYGLERAKGCELLPTRYDAVAIAFGGHGEHVSTAEALSGAIDRAIASALPAVIDVAIEGLPAPDLGRLAREEAAT